jgi:hypothetical protein
MSDSKPLQLPTDLANYLSQYLKPEDVAAATLVETPRVAPSHPRHATVYISYIPRLRCFSAHRDGLGEVRPASMPELLQKLAAIFKGKEFSLVLSRVAKAEVAARRKGVPRAEGWH